MIEPDLACREERRREDVRSHSLSGLDYVEVSDDQRNLHVVFLGKVSQDIEIKKENLQITGGRRIRDIQVTVLLVNRDPDPAQDDSMDITVDQAGDFSTYTLSVVQLDGQGYPTDKPMQGFDRRYAEVDFTFKAGCPIDLDCKVPPVCPPPIRTQPDINYLAKDYQSFRQLILDRLALIMPDWQETHAPDIGVALVELLAYAGDCLSYYQDAVATEAYLGTARQRISVRRHARLVDYQISEGCNARAWVTMTADSDVSLKSREIYFSTAFPGAPNRLILQPADIVDVPSGSYEVFEPLVEATLFQLGDPPADLAQQLLKAKDLPIQYVRDRLSSNSKRLLAAYGGSGFGSLLLQQALAEDWKRLQTGDIFLYQAHSQIPFYTWGDCRCCLPRGATQATLRDEWVDASAPAGSERATTLRICVNDVLIFEELLGPKTGNPADADPTHRQAVRLTKVTPDIDSLYDQPVVEIEWCSEDALSFPLCISAQAPPPDCTCMENISVARGNVILVDNGARTDEPLGTVPTQSTTESCTDCGFADTVTVPGFFRPALKGKPLTFSESLPPCGCASALITQNPRQALPVISLAETVTTPHGDVVTTWNPQPDLLESGPDDPNFVVEMDNDGVAHLRFGDGSLGRMPAAGATFQVRYRVGNGPAGNVGAETIRYLVFRHTTAGIGNLKPRNPLPATGGTAPENIAEAKLFAPDAFRDVPERAITGDDYATLAQDNARRLEERPALLTATPADADRDSSASAKLPRKAQEEEPGSASLLGLDVCHAPFQRLQGAKGTLRWTGSWYEALVAVDPLGTEEADTELLAEVAAYLEPYRRMGHDLQVKPAQYVPLDLVLTVCLLPNYLRGHVEAALLDVFSNRVLPDGRLGFFHPDNLSFGEGIYVSRIVAAAQAVTGVQSVEITRLERYEIGELPLGAETAQEELPPGGVLKLAPFEIARLDNDPSLPENGRLTLDLRGGR